MRILLTGATGFLGQHLVPHLMRAGHELTLALRRRSAVPEGVRSVVIGELDDATDWAEALAGAGAVIHLAGRAHQVHDTAPDPEAAFMAVNRDVTRALAREARAAGVERFLFMSTIHVLGHESAPGRPFDDETPPAPTSAYARSKRAAEEALAAEFPGEARSLVILRPPLLVGSGMKGNLERLARLVRRPLPLPFGAIHNRRTLLSADALSEAILAVLARWQSGPASGTYVIGDAAPVSTSDIVRALREGAGGKAILLPVPAALLRLGLIALGRTGLIERLLGDLEVDSRRFRRDFAWDPPATTLSALQDAVVPDAQQHEVVRR